ncbi:MAG: family 78 glycoside hydrolase catalytic domain [Candidatus Izemoplasmataceae bacterium]
MDRLKEYFITTNNSFVEGAVSRFTHRFEQEDIFAATLHITALGIYSIKINGVPIEKQLFAPGFTYYPKHLNVQTYDVTTELKNGTNTVEVDVGQGWYCGRFTHNNKTQIYGENIAVSWIFDIITKDGQTHSISSTENVLETTSEYEYAGFYDGEIINKKHNIKNIGQAKKYTGLLPENFEQTMVPVLQQDQVDVVKVIDTNGGIILDFGQNFAGYITINTALMDSDTITIQHGEVLYPEDTLYLKNLRKAKAQIVFTKGDQAEIYKPQFTYMGFRYVFITGCSYQEELIHAYAIHSDMLRTGYFICANRLVQRLYENQIWSQKSNYVELPTDCPQRDERMGYTGDGQVFSLTGAYNYDTRLFWRKVLKDIRYSQMDNTEGYVGPTIPAEGPAGIGYMSMLGWGNAITIIPEMLYQQYGDESFIDRNYEAMKLHAEAEIRKLNEHYLWMGINLGDWLAPGKDVKWFAINNNPVSNTFIINDFRVISDYAKRNNLEEDYNRYYDFYKKAQAGYIATFINENGMIQGDYQGAYVLALQYVLKDHKIRQTVMNNLVENVKENGLQTGFFATEYLLPLLIEANEPKLAYDILLNESNPGWMYQINHGATSIWERWDAILEDGSVNETVITNDNMVSFNHYAFGSIGRFYYQYILGIQAIEPGYQKIKIRPYIDDRLRAVSGSYESVQGLIEVSWRIIDGAYELNVTVPTSATIILLSGEEHEVIAGTYVFREKYKKENGK